MLGNYTITSRLLGDPRPDRLAASEFLKSRLCRPQRDRVGEEQRPVVQRIHQCLFAVRDGFGTVLSVSDRIGLSYRAVGGYLKAAKDREWLVIDEVGAVPGGGRTYSYAVTAAGRAELSSLEQGA